MSNYIFVDIDGPLLPGKMHLFQKNRKIRRSNLVEANPIFDQFAVQAHNIWLKYSNAKIVFSTNWATAQNMTPEILIDIMSDNGLEFKGHYHDEILTPKKFTSERGSEIWWWLLDNAKDGDTFLAVDDDQSCRYLAEYITPRDQDKHYTKPKPNLSGKWLDINFTEGLSWANFIDGCEYLGIDIEDINEQEFGIKKLTKEEKIQREKDIELLARCMF
jgi:hypothetical protein